MQDHMDSAALVEAIVQLNYTLLNDLDQYQTYLESNSLIAVPPGGHRPDMTVYNSYVFWFFFSLR